MNDASFVRFDTILERDGQTDGQTDRHRDRRTSLLLQYHRIHDLLCYRAGKISCLSLSFLGSSPRFPTGLCFSIPLGDFRPRDSFASHHPTSNPEYAPELGAAFSTPAFSTPAILMVPSFPLPRFQSTPNYKCKYVLYVTLFYQPNPVIFSCIIGVIPYSQLPNALVGHVKSHRIVYKTSKNRSRLCSRGPRPRWGSILRFCGSTGLAKQSKPTLSLHNVVKYWLIFKILSLSHSPGNL